MQSYYKFIIYVHVHACAQYTNKKQMTDRCCKLDTALDPADFIYAEYTDKSYIPIYGTRYMRYCHVHIRILANHIYFMVFIK